MGKKDKGDNGMETLDKHWDWEVFELSTLKYVVGGESEEGKRRRNCGSRDGMESCDAFCRGTVPKGALGKV